MATWNSTRTVLWDQDMGVHYAKCQNSWEYLTVTDSLNVITKVGANNDFDGYNPPHEKIHRMGKEEALALLETLLDWAVVYEGANVVEKMLNDRKG